MDRIDPAAKEVAKRIRRYQFESFAVGVSMPEGVQDREDELRANSKLKGNETIKTQTARFIADAVAARLGKRVNKTNPDLTVIVSIGSSKVEVLSKPLFLYGRYTKPAGISQKRKPCQHCSGRGCIKCKATGFERRPSVEGKLRAKLAKTTGTDKMKFTWIGSEDRDSRVYFPGRPFVVELKSPVKRKVPRNFLVRSKRGLICISICRVLPSKPIGIPGFRFRTEITATVANEVNAESLAEVRKRFRRVVVRFNRPHERPVQKTVYSVRTRKHGKTLAIDAELDGGLPVKRFVSGELVSPSVSEVLKTEVKCRRFDIREVKETGRFEFGKVARL
jgi:tRNA pseudouridine synthase 10